MRSSRDETNKQPTVLTKCQVHDRLTTHKFPNLEIKPKNVSSNTMDREELMVEEQDQFPFMKSS